MERNTTSYQPALDYWMQTLSQSGFGGWPLGRAKSGNDSLTLSRAMPEELAQRWQTVAGGKPAAEWVVGMAVWATLLRRYGVLEPLVRTAPLTLAPVTEGLHQALYFPFTNPPSDFRSASDALKPQLKKALGYQNYPGADLERILAVNKVQVAPDSLAFFHVGTDAHSEVFEGADLALGYDGDARWTLSWIPGVLTGVQADRMLAHFFNLLAFALDNPDAPLAAVSLLTEAEKEEQFQTWNAKGKVEIPGEHLVDLISQQAEENPDAVALVQADRSWSFAALKTAVGQVALQLQAHGVQPGTVVGLHTEATAEAIVAMLGILQAGGTYLPLDPEYPASRLQYMVSQANASLVIGETEPLETEAKHVPLQSLAWEGDTLAKPLIHEQAAYIIFTSGSTGKPKGVPIHHRQALHLLASLQQAMSFDAGRAFILSASLSFDASIKEIFLPWLTGGTLHLYPNLRDIPGYAQYLVEAGIEVMHGSPLFWQATLQALDIAGTYPPLKYISSGGDALPLALANRMRTAFPTAWFMNLYGPTETTINATGLSIGSLIPEPITIGRALPGYRAYVVDAQGQVLPQGVAGELVLAGEGLSEGYLQQADATEKVFVSGAGVGEDRIYRTGDKVRWTADGNLEFLGRLDRQVKIRGYRVEPDELRLALEADVEVGDAYVAVKTGADGNAYLAAYITLVNAEGLEALKERMAQQLPHYLLPGRWLVVPNMPRNTAGKVDSAQLPDPEAISEATFEAPQTDTERQLLALWERLLKREGLGRNHDFFAEGGHSLLALQLLSQVVKNWSVRFTLSDVFAYPVLAEMAAFIDGQAVEVQAAITPVAKADHYPVSPTQRRLWIVETLEEGDVSYIVPASYSVVGDLKPEALKKAVHSLVERHESLRTNFIEVAGEPHMVVHEDASRGYHFEFADLSAHAQPEEQALLHIAQETNHTFSLTDGPLVRVKLLQLAPQEYRLALTFHHIISDGWSTDRFGVELMQAYHAWSTGNAPVFSVLPYQFKDYASWINERVHGEAVEASRQYWKNQYKDDVPVLELPSDFPRPKQQRHRGRSVHSLMDRQMVDRIEKMAKRYHATPYMFLLAVFKTLLMRYTRQTDFSVGVLVAGRDLAGLEEQQGFFVNTLPIRSVVTPEQDFITFLDRIKQQLLEAFAHQQYPFEQIVSDLQLPRDTNRSPIFDVLLGFQPKMHSTVQSVDGIAISPLPLESTTSKYDLAINIHEAEQGYHLYTEYDADLFLHARIERFVEYYHRLVDAILDAPQEVLWSYDFVPAEEKQRLLYDFNPTAEPFDQDETLHGMFMKRAQESPDTLALVFEEHSYSYGELDALTNQLAHYLLEEHQLPLNTPVAAWLRRRHWFSIGYLGVAKAGGVFMPLDVKNPKGRITQIFSESNPAMLWYDADIDGKGVAGSIPALTFEELMQVISQYPTTPVDLEVPSTNGLYINYSSGSTGQPKGIINDHRGQINLVTRQKWYIGKRGTKYAQCASVGFDICVSQANVCFTSGGSMYVISEDMLLDMKSFTQYLRDNNVRAGVVPTALFNLLIEHDPELVHEFSCLVSGGEAQSPAQLRRIGAPAGQPDQFINAYGPTETAGVCVFFDLSRLKPDFHAVPIGNPGPNMRVYILDEHYQLVPHGAMGQLCIGGVCVGPGYLSEELTAAKFLPDPFFPGERMYLSGDLARHSEEGLIMFEGRIDFQVKLRGQRIELGEISSVLEDYPDIREAVTVMRKNHTGADYLAAYYGSAEPIDTTILRSFLLEKMPEYMVPSVFVHLTELPRNNSQKVDRKRLPEPVLEENQEYIAPTTEEEKVLADVWQTVLQQQHVSTTDNFFAIGGDSIKAIQVAARLNQRGYLVKARQIMQTPVLSDLATHLEVGQRQVDQGKVYGSVALSPIQQWFFEETTGSVDQFNQAVMMQPTAALDTQRLQAVVAKLVEHHDALRTQYQQQGEEWTATILQEAPAVVVSQHAVANAEELDALVASLQGSLSVRDGKLMAVAHIQMPEGERVLWIIHHLVVDGISWRVLLEDAESLYTQLSEGKTPTLPAKTDSWLAWQSAVADYAAGGKLEAEKEYWRQALAEKHQVLISKVEGKVRDRLRHHLTLSAELTGQLLREANATFGTDVNDFLLAALAGSLHNTFGVEAVQVALEGHGREEVLAPNLDTSRTIGWFTSMYPITLQAKQASRQALLVDTKDQLHRVPNRGVGYGLLHYLQQEEGLAANPQVAFNYLGQFGQGDETATFWSEAPESVDHSIDPNRRWPFALGLTAAVADGVMEIEWVWPSHAELNERIPSLSEAFESVLKELVQLAIDQTGKVLTASDLGYPYLKAAELAKLQAQLPTEDVYRLSPLQEGLYFHAQHAAMGHDQYVRQLHYQLDAALQPALVQEAFRLLSQRHEALRLAILQVPGHPPLQAVVAGREVPVTLMDLRGITEVNQAEAVAKYREQDLVRGFHLQNDPLTRVALFQKGERSFEVCWTFHHILIDGWCVGILTNEFFQTYQALVSGVEPQLPAATPYGEFIAWLESQDQKAALEYWQQYLASYDEVASLPFAKTRQPEGYTHGVVNFSFDEATTQQIHALAARFSVTFSTIFQALWGLQLGKYNYRRDVVFGKVVSGRPADLPGVENMLGLFINTIPVRVQYQPEDTIETFLRRLQASNAEAEAYQYSQLSEIQGNRTLFDQLLVFENYPVEENMDALAGEDMHIPEVEMEEETDYDFNLLIGPGDDTKVKFTFNRQRFEEADIRRVAEHFQHLVHAVLENTNQAVGQLAYAPEQELKAATQKMPRSNYPAQNTVVQEFERQVFASPEAVALVMGEDSLTYAQLNAKANQVGHYFREQQQIKPNDLVGLHADRSMEMMVILLGILKSGGAYLPLDPGYPVERLQMMLDDTKAKCIISEQQLDMPGAVQMTELMDSVAGLPTSNPMPVNYPQDTLYVMYTSGSTGRPKGVEVPHQGAVRLVKDTNYVTLSAADRLLQTGSLSFDATTFEYWSMLLNGGTLHLLPQDQLLDASQLKAYLQAQGITVMWMTSSWFNQLVDLDVALFSGLKQLLVGGEKLSTTHINKVRAAHPDLQLINGYGPTENTTFSICHRIAEDHTEAVPLGTPISNSGVCILDIDGQPVPQGVVGELFLTGDGLAKGYLNRPDLTAEKFVALPQVGVDRAYATGDLGYWMADGTVAFVGRVDEQVKIRGHRIEPGEIAQVMQTLPSIEMAVVQVLTDEQLGKYLAGYYTAAEAVEPAVVKAYLANRLPEYMVPAHLIALDQFPLNPNGKVDRKALPVPDPSELRREYVAPRDEVERQLADIWSAILGIKQVGAQDHFFELGGHSLKVVMLQSRLAQAFDLHVELKELFQHPVLEALAKEIKRKQWMKGQSAPDDAAVDTSNVIEI